MNSHIRDKDQIFILQTETNNMVSAKQLEFEEYATELKKPVIQFTRPERGFPKDCWIQNVKGKDLDEEYLVYTICKSSTDEYLNSGCVRAKLVKTELSEIYKTTVENAVLKAQDIDLSYPCLVSNIGLSRIMIQSMTNPN